MKEKFLCFGKDIEMPPRTAQHRTPRRQTVEFVDPPAIVGKMSVVGNKEGKGPLKDYFDVVLSDDKMNEKSFEKAEFNILKRAIDGSIEKANLKPEDVDLMIGGDLLNQITSSEYVAREYDSCFLGVYSACSTMTESLAIGASLISGGMFNNVVCSTVSHFATAERQYRFPLEYGCQRPPYSQWTVTGAGSIVLKKGVEGIKIKRATFGKVVDYGTNDLNNMGAAMAPAAMESILALFRDTQTTEKDYDLIITGDLGKLGSDILRDIIKEKGVTLGQNYTDCGVLVYDHTQNCYQGGSGAGCSACVVSSFVLDKMQKGELKKVAYFATGALMSPLSCYQGETIPCISHGVVLEA